MPREQLGSEKWLMWNGRIKPPSLQVRAQAHQWVSSSRCQLLCQHILKGLCAWLDMEVRIWGWRSNSTPPPAQFRPPLPPRKSTAPPANSNGAPPGAGAWIVLA